MTIRLRRRHVLLSIAATALATRARADDTLRVGIMGGQGEEIMDVVADEAKKRGLVVKSVVFSDYLLPNEALESGDIDANAFQHLPYLQNQIRSRGYHLVSVGWTTVSPIGIYSHKIHTIDQIPTAARIGIPNDPSNGGRGLLQLQEQKVLRLRDGVGLLPTPADIVDNPKDLHIVELDAGIIARSIDDLTAAVVNTDWAVRAGLDLTHDLVAREAVADNPYRNIIAVKQGHENDPRIRTFVAAYQTDRLRDFLQTHYHGTTVAAW